MYIIVSYTKLHLIYVGVSPVILRKGYRTVTVRAYCFVDGEYEQQKRRKFSLNL